MSKRLVRILVIIFFALFFLMRILHQEETHPSWQEENERVICEEFAQDDSVPVLRRTQYRTWNSYAADSIFCLHYVIDQQANEEGRDFRRGLHPPDQDYLAYWRYIYDRLATQNEDRIHFIQDSLLEMARQLQLSRSSLARLTVSFVQDIPYQYVLPGPCNVSDHPCVGFEPFGILSPVEFLYSLSGDCDTRSVLLFTLLKNFGFHPLLMISNAYRHAMIALDIPAAGDYVIFKGKRFYFWETTNTGWLPGMLPPDTNNVDYWEISLDYEYSPLVARTH